MSVFVAAVKSGINNLWSVYIIENLFCRASFQLVYYFSGIFTVQSRKKVSWIYKSSFFRLMYNPFLKLEYKYFIKCRITTEMYFYEMIFPIIPYLAKDKNKTHYHVT